MAIYQEAQFKLTNRQLSKLKSSAKNKTGKTLKLNKKNVFLTTRKAAKIRNVFANNMSTDIKLSQAQICNINQSGESVGSWLVNLGRKALANVAIYLARDNLPELVSNLNSSATNKFARKISGKEAVRAGKGFILFNLNEDVDDFIKVIKSLEDRRVLIDGVTETVKHKIKMQDELLDVFLAPLAASLV